VDDNQRGPVSERTLIATIKSGLLDNKTKIWKLGLPKWILLRNTPFREFLPKTEPPPLDQVDTGSIGVIENNESAKRRSMEGFLKRWMVMAVCVFSTSVILNSWLVINEMQGAYFMYRATIAGVVWAVFFGGVNAIFPRVRVMFSLNPRVFILGMFVTNALLVLAPYVVLYLHLYNRWDRWYSDDSLFVFYACCASLVISGVNLLLQFFEKRRLLRRDTGHNVQNRAVD